MSYKRRINNNLKLLFSKKGYNITFNKKYHEYNDVMAFNEKQNGHNSNIILATEYFTLAAFLVLFIILGIYLGFESLIYIPITTIIPISLILTLNTSKFLEISKKYGDDEGTLSLIELNLSFVPPLIMMGVFLGLVKDNWWFGLAGTVISIYPWLLMLCRINVFSDDSIPRYEGPKMSIELGPGYVPIVYWLLSFQIGLNVTRYGITGLGSYLNSGHPTLLFSMVTLILGIISQTIVVSPDIINRVGPVDMRMKKGYVLMVVLAILLVFASWTIMTILKT